MTWPPALTGHLETLAAPADPDTLVTDQQHRVSWEADTLEVRHLVHGTRLELVRGQSMPRAVVQLSREGRRHAWPRVRELLGRSRVDWWLHLELRSPGDRHPLRLSAPVADATLVEGLPELHVRTGGGLLRRVSATHVVSPEVLLSVLATLHRVGVPARMGGAEAQATDDAIVEALDARLEAERAAGASPVPEASAEADAGDARGVELPPLPPRPLLAGLVAGVSMPVAALVLGLPLWGSPLWLGLMGLMLVGLVRGERHRLASMVARGIAAPQSWADIEGISIAFWMVAAISGLLVVKPWGWPLPDEVDLNTLLSNRHWVWFPVLVGLLSSLGMAAVEARGHKVAPDMIGARMALTERLTATLTALLIAVATLAVFLAPLVALLSRLGPVVFGAPIVLGAALIGRAQARAWRTERHARS